MFTRSLSIFSHTAKYFHDIEKNIAMSLRRHRSIYTHNRYVILCFDQQFQGGDESEYLYFVLLSSSNRKYELLSIA